MEANNVFIRPCTRPAYAALLDVLVLVSLGFHLGSRQLGEINGLVVCDAAEAWGARHPPSHR